MKILLRGQLKFMSHHFDVIGVSSSGKSVEEVEQQEGIRVEVVEMTRVISPIKDLLATIKLYRLLKREKPLIVHTHTPKAGIVGMLAAWMAGVKYRFHTVAGMPLLIENGPRRWLLDRVEKLTYRLSTLVLPNSRGLYEIILEHGYAPESKLQIIGQGSSNGIDVTHFDPVKINQLTREKTIETLGIQDSKLTFVYVGRFVKDKGVNELIQAFDTLSKQNPDVYLVMVGTREDDLDPLEPLTEQLMQSNNRIVMAGWQKDVRPYMAVSDALILPTYREGFPNVVLQGGAMDLPCIVTDINGCNEIITNGLNGLIIPPKNRESLLEAMQFMIDNPEALIEMSRSSRDNIVKNYRREYIWSELLLLYQQLEKDETVQKAF